jgi:hypothetical protein
MVRKVVDVVLQAAVDVGSIVGSDNFTVGRGAANSRFDEDGRKEVYDIHIIISSPKIAPVSFLDGMQALLIFLYLTNPENPARRVGRGEPTSPWRDGCFHMVARAISLTQTENADWRQE